MIDPNALISKVFDEKVHSYTRRDTMLYALSLGFGDDPLDSWQLKHVLEDRLRAFPTQALILAHPGPWTADPGSGVNRLGVVHGEQSLEIHQRIPAEGQVRSRNRVTAVVDKGADKGAVIETERDIHDVATGELLATLRGTTFCRRDGGFDTTGQKVFGKVRAVQGPRPDRPPDTRLMISTLKGAALLYRLNGDYNPLHSHPESARQSGFDRPISHGLFTFGLSARLLEAAFEPFEISSISARFASPMYPGETLRLDIWKDSAEVGASVWFDAFAMERECLVLSRGRAELRVPFESESARSET